MKKMSICKKNIIQNALDACKVTILKIELLD